MQFSRQLRNKIILAASFLLLSHNVFGQHTTATVQANSAKELVGLWEAKRRFGPDVRGTLLITQSKSGWRAEIAGHSAPVKLEGDSVFLELQNGRGKFQGQFDARRTRIVGHWIQPGGIEFGTLASPVTLTKYESGGWRGSVVPLDDAMTFYLMVKAREDGSTGAFLRNPERNLGWTRYRIDNIERAGASVKLFAANKGNEKGRVIAEGTYNADSETLSIYLSRGGTFDFRRVEANETSDFHPRGQPTVPYVYTPPPKLADGWQTGTLEEVGISRA
ncbi:MAG TPA: hypothetical protein VK308_13850, partial [Pyrinomonadaceae bacterium]|nr:hypothetical protein [Pyrinomonadaceae bacterium]